MLRGDSWILSCATCVQIKAIKPPVEISGVGMGRIRQAIAGWANNCMRPTWRVRVLSRPNEERITDAVRLIRRWVSSTFWWRWDYRHTKSLSRCPVPAPVKLLPYGAIEIWLFFFPLLCLSDNVNRRSKDCFNTEVASGVRDGDASAPACSSLVFASTDRLHSTWQGQRCGLSLH